MSTNLSPEQLKNLSRKEKLQLLDLMEEKERRAKDRRASYVPNEGQLEVHRSKSLERYCFAGNGSGKSCMLVNEVMWAADGYNPITKTYTHVPATIIVVLDAPSKVEDVFINELKKWRNIDDLVFEKKGKPHISRITYPNGSQITFMFHLQEELAAESIEWHHLFFDEPPTRRLYIALKRGGRSKEALGRILLIGTPITAAWLRRDVYEPWSRGARPNTECFRFTTYVNKKNLAEGYLEDFESVLSEKERAIRLEGNFFDLEGLALAHLFDREHHLINPVRWPHNWPTMVIIDPHPKKAHVAILVGITQNDELVYLKELTSRKPPSEFAKELREFYAGYRVVDIVCDSLGSSELTGGAGNLSFIQVLNNNGVKVRATTYSEKQDEAFIQMIQEALVIPSEPDNMGQQESRLKIVKHCKGIISDIESVEWQKFKNMDEFKPRLAIGNKDFLACLKYALAAQPRFSKGSERVIRGRSGAGFHQRRL